MKAKLFLLMIFLFNSILAQHKDSPREIAMETTIEHIGDYAQFAPSAFSLITILAKNDKKGLWQFSKSASTNLIATWILKYSINKPRPEGKLDGNAFPSGHTSFAFQGASFLQRRYGWKYGIPAYLVAGFVGYSRLEGLNDRHDGWDVLAGAAVGIGSTYLFTTPYMEEHLELSFKSGGGDYLVGVKYKF
ncbi:lipid A 1-phosphatase [Arenibacter sp. NBRC 103722]|uniref:phosphatase PAP2 family protein n=1 Tax=Arenibacter sp. NBRC 103722 TaxID=1113929 RepID=UPI000853390B|nr:phosphatase PAP2 family protein [Arenibacter sp. NBRC 103722]MDX1766411.1 phosphatase PAP2 family protein [Arenibacter troitsensis]GBF21564.1 lipid A 1-phosphatase [Arenibacter sp. NBRC 103722]|tara:strand:- start:3080 stop:3649 length:570 start_codon:yes stop_codon:yes gene_type:complete